MKRRKRPGALVEGRDYYCGTCAGHGVVPCDFCVEGDTVDGRCGECRTADGRVVCPECHGGAVPVQPPVSWAHFEAGSGR